MLWPDQSQRIINDAPLFGRDRSLRDLGEPGAPHGRSDVSRELTHDRMPICARECGDVSECGWEPPLVGVDPIPGLLAFGTAVCERWSGKDCDDKCARAVDSNSSSV